MARQKSIQAEPSRSRGNKSSSAAAQTKTLRKAHRLGIAWDDYEVERLVTGIQRDETTLEMALAIGRSYYGVQGARAHVAFALRHSNAIWS